MQNNNDKKNATIVWNRLRTNLLAAEDAIKEIIEGRLWEPLGYATFADAWSDRMTGIKLADTVQAQVVYALFAEGATTEDVIKATLIPDSKVERLQEAQDLGLNPELGAKFARTRKKAVITPKSEYYSSVSAHERHRPGPRTKVHLEIGTTKLAYWEDQYKKANQDATFKEFMTAVLEEAMDQSIKSFLPA